MRRLLAFLLVGVTPWTVVAGPGGVGLVFLFGLQNPATAHFVSLPEYLFVLTSGLPDRLLAWPASSLLYVGGLGVEVVDRFRGGSVPGGDASLAAGLFGLAGLAHLAFAFGLETRADSVVVPLGPALVGLVLWWSYWPSFRTGAAEDR